MKIQDLFEKWGLSSLKVNAHFAELEFAPQTEDMDAAWELYVELLTRITTQRLEPDSGDEKTALDSVYSLFGVTRSILKEKGRKTIEFTKIAIVVLNQVVRPFTAKWHKKELAGAFNDGEECRKFREELEALQTELKKYTGLLSELAGVEDLTDLELE